MAGERGCSGRRRAVRSPRTMAASVRCVDGNRRRDWSARRCPRGFRALHRDWSVGRYLGTPRDHGALGVRRQHALADARCRGRNDRHRRLDRMACHDVPVPRTPGPVVGTAAAARGTELHPRVRRHRPARVRGQPAEYAARPVRVDVGARLLVPRDPIARRGDDRDVARALPLRVPPRAGRLHRAELRAVRGEPHAGARSAGQLPDRGGAARASRHRGRGRARADGDAERIRDHRLLCGADPDRRHLRCLAQHGQHRRRRTARDRAGDVRARPGGNRAHQQAFTPLSRDHVSRAGPARVSAPAGSRSRRFSLVRGAGGPGVRAPGVRARQLRADVLRRDPRGGLPRLRPQQHDARDLGGGDRGARRNRTGVRSASLLSAGDARGSRSSRRSDTRYRGPCSRSASWCRSERSTTRSTR